MENSLLIAELAYSGNEPTLDAAKIAIFAASLVSALVATGLLLARNRHYRQFALVEEADRDGDGVPDVYQGDARALPHEE